MYVFTAVEKNMNSLLHCNHYIIIMEVVLQVAYERYKRYLKKVIVVKQTERHWVGDVKEIYFVLNAQMCVCKPLEIYDFFFLQPYINLCL